VALDLALQDRNHRFVSKIKRMGFDFVEVPDRGPQRLKSMMENRPSAALDDHGLSSCVGCGAFGPTRDLTHEDPKVHANCFDYTQPSLDLCATLGRMSFAGPMYFGGRKRRLLPPAERKKEWDRAVGNLRKAL
jgi:D-psicose/D-tagatose/L-ribulose 3-epimerase